MGAYEIEYARRVLGIIADFSAEEWREIRRLCQLIRLDPLQDNRNKIGPGAADRADRRDSHP